jgi:hypothetical protein
MKFTYRRVLFGDAMDRIGTTRSWYQVGGAGWLYGDAEIRQTARLVKVQFCYW